MGFENFCTKLPKGIPLRQNWSNKSFGVCGSDVVLTLLFGLIPRTHGPSNVYSAQRLDLFAWCVRLSRLLVGFRTHFKSLHFLLLLHGGEKKVRQNRHWKIESSI